MSQLALVLSLDPPPSLADADFEAWWSEVGVPLVDVLDPAEGPHPTVGLVVSGPLLGWMADTRPAELARLRRGVEQGTIELVATPFHGPVVSSIPSDDATDQVLSHLTLVRRLLEARPSGAWLPRQVWDPSVPRIFARADIDWTVVDDTAIATHHVERGIDAWGAWRTEREGHGLVLLGNDSGALGLRGGAQPDEMVVYLQGRASQGADQLVFAFEVARRGKDEAREVAWVAAVIRSLASSSVKLVRPSEVARQVRGRIYLPSWAPEGVSLPWEKQLLRSPDADRLHKRMLRVSRQLTRLGKRVRRNDADAPDPDQVIQARRYLHRAQGAAHYEPAGIAHPHLRHRAWRDLLRAEDVAEHAAGTFRRLVAERVDLGTGSVPQVLLRTPSMALVCDPELGGGLSELGVFPAAINLVDPQSREGRPIHVGFTEQFPHPETPMATLQDHGQAVDGPARVEIVERSGDASVRAVFSRDVVLADDEGAHALQVWKTYAIRVEPRLDVTYELKNLDEGAVRSRFAVEIPLCLGVHPDQLELVVAPHRSSAAQALEYPEVRVLDVTGGAVNVRLGFQRPARLWVFPAALGVTVWAEWPLEIWSQEATRIKIKLEAVIPDSLDDDDDGVPMEVLEPSLKVGDTLVLQRPKPHPEDQRVPAHHRVESGSPVEVVNGKRRRKPGGEELAARLGLVPPRHRFRPQPSPLYQPPRPRRRLDDVPPEADDGAGGVAATGAEE